MQSTTHMAGGASAAAAYLLFAHPATIQAPPLILTALGIGAIGGLVPDIDHPKSKISQILRPINVFVSRLFSHRGLFHAPFFYLALWSLMVWKFHNPAYLLWTNLFFMGIASHLVLDSLNPSGIPLFIPFEAKHHHIAKIKTGSKTEIVVRTLLYVLYIGLLTAIMFPNLFSSWEIA